MSHPTGSVPDPSSSVSATDAPAPDRVIVYGSTFRDPVLGEMEEVHLAPPVGLSHLEAAIMHAAGVAPEERAAIYAEGLRAQTAERGHSYSAASAAMRAGVTSAVKLNPPAIVPWIDPSVRNARCRMSAAVFPPKELPCWLGTECRPKLGEFFVCAVFASAGTGGDTEWLVRCSTTQRLSGLISLIRGYTAEYNVRCLAHDSWASHSILHGIEREVGGLQLVSVPQNAVTLGPAMREIGRAISEGRLHHDGDPCLAAAVTECGASVSFEGNAFPVNISRLVDMGPVFAMLMAFSRAMAERAVRS